MPALYLIPNVARTVMATSNSPTEKSNFPFTQVNLLGKNGSFFFFFFTDSKAKASGWWVRLKLALGKCIDPNRPDLPSPQTPHGGYFLPFSTQLTCHLLRKDYFLDNRSKAVLRPSLSPSAVLLPRELFISIQKRLLNFPSGLLLECKHHKSKYLDCRVPHCILGAHHSAYSRQWAFDKISPWLKLRDSVLML